MPLSRGHRPLLLLLAGAVAAAGGLLLVPAGRAAAHPLGNFTINHYDRIDVSEQGIDVYRVLDMAEIPTFQERQKIDANGDGSVDEAESAAYGSAKAGELLANIRLTAGGDDVTLSETGHELSFPPGQGGLLLLRLTATYHGALPDGWQTSSPRIAFEDRNYGDRLGWREIVVRNGSGVALVDPSVGAEDVSHELTSYPTDALSSPLDERLASFGITPGIGAAPAPTPDHVARAVRGNTDSTLARFANLISKKDLSFGVVALALLAALGFGALHALSPGHGKTIVAAYLVGSRGTARHALLLGTTVTATHTSSVYLLGFIAYSLSAYVVPETLYPWLGLWSGALIILMGLSLFVGRMRASGLMAQTAGYLRSRARAVAAGRVVESRLVLASAEAGAMRLPGSAAQVRGVQAEDHAGDDDLGDGHAHVHDETAHQHGIGPAHSHAVPGQDGEPVTWRRLVGLGIFGGLLPCPSAIVLMLGAISLHRIGFGLVLILFFSIGLAAVLTGIGFVFVYAQTLTQRIPLLARAADRANHASGAMALAIRGLPVASAAAVVVAGALITMRAAGQF